MINIEFLNSVRGDAPMYIEDGEPEERRKLAEKLTDLLKEGQAMFLIQGDQTRRIQGYDEASNQWLVLSSALPRPPQTCPPAVRRGRGRPRLYDRVPAAGTRVTAVGRVGGG